MSYQRILTVQDISCVGQCSMTVALPILSACGHETCVLPAAVLSTHTGGFTNPVKLDLGDVMGDIWQHWQREGIGFDAIYTGYLGSVKQVEETKKMIAAMKAEGGLVIVDPAMADHGKLYKGLDDNYRQAMQELCFRSDIMMPNMTESCMMTGIPLKENYDQAYITQILDKLSAMGAKSVLLTGVGFAADVTGFALLHNGEIFWYQHEKLDKAYHGTGDIFASAFVGALMRGKDRYQAGVIAAQYTAHCIRCTMEGRTHWYGVRFEAALPKLMEMLAL